MSTDNLPAHAEFGPSSLKYVSGCAGYHGKEGTSAAAEKGTRIHDALEHRDPTSLEDEEEVAMYEQLLADEEEFFNMVFPNATPEIHRELKLVLELDCKTLTFGTADIVAYHDNIGLCADYKTGISKIDDPRDNFQAKAYTLAVFQKFPDLAEIHFAFLVPQRDGIQYGKFDRSEMEDLRKELSDIISKAEKVRPLWENGAPEMDDLNPTVNCRFCRHEERCPALGHLVVEVAKRYRPDLLPEGSIAGSDIEDIEVLDKLVTVAKIAEAWAGSIKHKAMQRALAGEEFPTHYLKKMGSAPKVLDKQGLRGLAEKHGLSEDDVFDACSLTLKPIVDKLRSEAPRGQKGKVADNFTQEAFDLDIVEEGAPRFSLSDKK